MGVLGICHRIDAAFPSLKNYGLGVFLAWAFTSFGVQNWSFAIDLGIVGPFLFFFISTFMLLVTFVAFLLISGDHAKRAVFSRKVLFGICMIACLLVIALNMYDGFSPAFSSLSVVAAALTGVSSALLDIWAARMLSRYSSQEAFHIISRNMLVLLVICLAVFVIPHSAVQNGATSICFVISALLFILEDCASCRNADQVSCEPAEHEPRLCLRRFWRFYLVVILASFVFSLELTLFSIGHDPATDSFIDGIVPIACMVMIAGFLFYVGMAGERARFENLFHPAIIALVLAYSVTTFWGTEFVGLSIVSEVCRFAVQVYLMVACVCLAARAGIATVPTMLMGWSAFLIGDLIGRSAPLLVPALYSDARVGFATLVVMILTFMVVLVIVFPKERLLELGSVLSEVQVQPSESKMWPAQDNGRGEQMGKAGGSETENSLSHTEHFRLSRCKELGDSCGLTEREQEVLNSLMYGFSANRIASDLCVSVATVRTHMRGIYSKLGVHSREELMRVVEGDPLESDR